jgi:hypothetical protein
LSTCRCRSALNDSTARGYAQVPAAFGALRQAWDALGAAGAAAAPQRLVAGLRQLAALAAEAGAPLYLRASALYTIGVFSVVTTGVPELAGPAAGGEVIQTPPLVYFVRGSLYKMC